MPHDNEVRVSPLTSRPVPRPKDPKLSRLEQLQWLLMQVFGSQPPRQPPPTNASERAQRLRQLPRSALK